MLKTIKNYLYLVAVSCLLFVAYSCSDDTVVTPAPQANTINGRVTFADTNFITSGGTYLISIFANDNPPPQYWFGPPTAFDTLDISFNSSTGKYEANYSFTNVNNGRYVVAVGFRRDTGGQSPTMGIYGCDTARAQFSNCFTTPIRAEITNNAGVNNINFLSWADTTNKVF